MIRSSNNFVRVKASSLPIPTQPSTIVWQGDNLTSDYFDDSFNPNMAYGGDQTEYGGVRHFEAIKNTP